MSGLLARARHVRDKPAGTDVDRADGEPLFDDAGVSAEKKREILAQIDRIVATQRTPVPGAAFQLRASKSGILLPLVLNAAVAVLAIVVVVVAGRYFQVRQRRLSDQAATYLSTEGRLVDAIRRESEAKLRQKDTEIADIQGQLEQLDRESEELRSSMDQRIGAREAQLRAQMESVLEAERQRLSSQGLQDADIERRLAQVADQKAREQAKELETFRAALAAEARAREVEIQRAREQNLESLRKADLERMILLEAQKTAEDTKAGFDSERQAFRDQVSTAERRLRDLEETQRREQIVSDQILGSYAKVIEEISASRYEEARQDLLKFRRYLTDPALNALPAVAKRKQVDLFLIAALQAIVAPEYFQALESREALARIEQSVLAAEEKLRAGDTEGAQTLYTQAIGMVAAVKAAVAALAEMDGREREAILRESVLRGTRALGQNDIAAAAAEFRQMLGVLPETDRALFGEAVSNLERAFLDRQARAISERDSALAAAREELRRRVGELQGEAAAREKKAREDAARSEREAAAAREGQLAKRLDELLRLEGATTALSAGYQSGVARARGLLSGEGADPIRAKATLGDAFRSSAAKELLPGLPEVLDLLSSSLETTARGVGYTAGYRAAMDDIADYTSYIGGAAGDEAEGARARLQARVESDPAFRSAVGGIQSVVGKEGVQARLVQATTRLLGSVASASGDRIVVEVLGRSAAAAGARIEVRRLSSPGTEETIARGVIDSVDGDRIVARLERSADGTLPRVRSSDAVYLNVQ